MGQWLKTTMIDPDFRVLWNTLLPVAQQTLGRHGEFYPLAAAVSRTGQATSIAGDLGIEKPKSADVIRFLVTALAKQAADGEIRAAGLCYDVRIPHGKYDKLDAIQGHLELVSGEAVDVFIPYSKGLFGKIKYEEIFASKSQRQIFGGS